MSQTFKVWSCIQQRKKSCLPYIRNHFPVLQHFQYGKKICMMPGPGMNQFRQWSQVDRMLTNHRHGLLSIAYSAIAQSVCEWGHSACWRRVFKISKVRIRHSVEDKLSHFDSKIACLCQSIKINNNKQIYGRGHVQKPTVSEVKLAELSFSTGMG